jgi:hypothetical protein
MMIDPSSAPANSAVLSLTLDRAAIATVGGELGGALARYLDAVEHGPDEAAFGRLSRAHGAALDANRALTSCLGRLGGHQDLRGLGRDVNACARWLDDAYGALAEARRPPSAARRLARRIRRRAAGPTRADRAREYAHAAMAFSEHVARMRELARGV